MTARLRGLAALVALLGLVVGLPVVLLALGGPGLPRSLPSLDGIRDVLLRPDDGTLALTAVKVIAWAAWAYLTAAIAVDVIARARRVRTPRLPGLRLSQPLAHHLVGAAAALFIAAPLAAAPTAGHALPAASVVATATVTPGSGAVYDTRPTVSDPATPAPPATADRTSVSIGAAGAPAHRDPRGEPVVDRRTPPRRRGTLRRDRRPQPGPARRRPRLPTPRLDPPPARAHHPRATPPTPSGAATPSPRSPWTGSATRRRIPRSPPPPRPSPNPTAPT